jgi:hypothetical protein
VRMRLRRVALVLVLGSVSACSGHRATLTLACAVTIGGRSQTVSLPSTKDATALAEVSGYSARFTVIDANGSTGHLRAELHGPGLEPGTIASGGFDSSQLGSFAGRVKTAHGLLTYACNAGATA